MKVLIETQEECNSAESIISDYDSNKNKQSEQVIFELREAVNVFYIRNLDSIGPITCKFCKKKWMAICSTKSISLTCPSCNNITPIHKKINK